VNVTRDARQSKPAAAAAPPPAAGAPPSAPVSVITLCLCQPITLNPASCATRMNSLGKETLLDVEDNAEVGKEGKKTCDNAQDM